MSEKVKSANKSCATKETNHVDGAGDIWGSGESGGEGGTTPSIDHPILKGYFANWSAYSEGEPTGFPGSINRTPNSGVGIDPEKHHNYDENTRKMEDKIEKLDEIVYSFFEIKQNSDSNIVAESGGMMSNASTSYTHNAADVGKIYFFDAWSDLQASDASWAEKNSDLISEGYIDAVGGVDNLKYSLGYGNFSAFANHHGDFKKIMGIGGYGDHFQPGWEAAVTSPWNFVTRCKKSL